VKVVIRVDASIQIGTGHVMRCLSLAQAIKESKGSVEFICRKNKGNLIKKIQANGFPVFELEYEEISEIKNKSSHLSRLDSIQIKDAKECIKKLKSSKINMLIVDHYSLDEVWQKSVRPYFDYLMVIDDLANRNHMCDILLDQTYGRDQNDYEQLVPRSCRLLLGSQYALLRPEFSKWREYSLKRRSGVQLRQLLVNMGGTDSNNVTKQILRELLKCALPSETKITVVMGATAPHIESVRNEAKALLYETEIKIDVDNMAEIMANSDLAIGAGGSTTWERCCLGLPAIQLVIANNQKVITKLLSNINAVKPLYSVEDLSETIVKVAPRLKELTAASMKIADGMGAIKVAKEIMAL